ncbi:hypothetical protein GCM10022225_61320 [Plantactinospora mayteni]|uniref:Uncharacterized protein n=1 Tax=Plantactinospora mayteni TaxID=566021 RepID=A0ABQ4EZQ6_9ACTN|nr:hypothetical protein [Plantactinospora mayteni]GIH00126.1 hypothetical protein Pma05_66980 [Plantactinospora mayteni]
MATGNTALDLGSTTHDLGQSVPQDVVDVLLWRMAARVIAVHQPQPGQPTRCVSLLCTGQRYPCQPVRAAHRAQQVSRRVAAATARPEVQAARQVRVYGRPAEHSARRRFADWYAATRSMINSQRMRGRPSVPLSVHAPLTVLVTTDPVPIRGLSTG